jgi:hypothetical protein
MVITYNEQHCTETSYSDSYPNRATQLGITKKYINYVQEYTNACCDTNTMIITYKNNPSLRNYIYHVLSKSSDSIRN